MADNVVQVIIRAKDEASSELKKFQGTLGQAAAGVGAVAAAATGLSVALWNLGTSAAKRGEEMYALAQKTNTTVENISRLQYAAQQSETDVGTLSVAMRFLQRNVAESADKFSKYGIAVKDASGNLADTRTILLNAAEAFAKMADGPAKGAAAIELFGRAGTEMLPLLNQGKAGIQALEAEADKLGITVSSAAAALSDQFNDSMSRVKMQVEGLKMALAEQLLPAMIEIVVRASEAVSAIRAWTDEHGPLLRAIVSVTAKIAPFAIGITGLIAAIGALRLAFLALGISMGPIGWAIAGISAVLAGFAVKAAQTREKLKEPFRIKFEVEAGGLEAVQSAFQSAQMELSKLQMQRRVAEQQIERANQTISESVGEGGPRGSRPAGSAAASAEVTRLNAEIADLDIKIEAASEQVRGYNDMMGRLTKSSKAAADSQVDLSSKLAGAAAKKAADDWRVLLGQMQFIAENQPETTIKIKPVVMPITGEVPEFQAAELPVEASQEWLDAVELTNEQMGDIITKYETTNALVLGMAAGMEAFAKQGQIAFDLFSGVGDAVFRGMMDLVDQLGRTFAETLFEGGNILINLGKTVEKIVKQIITDLIAAIAKALLFKAIMNATGLGFLPFASGGMVKMATGGSVTPHSNGAPGPPPLLRASSGLTVPGAVQVFDKVPALLSPGEVVLPVVNGQSPAGVVTDLAALGRELSRSVHAAQTQPRAAANYVNINAFNLDALRDMLRHGDLSREQLRAMDLGRA